MLKIPVKIKRVDDGKTPEYKTEGAAGFDFYAIDTILLDPYFMSHTGYTLRTGVMVEIPSGFEMQMRGRSGLAFHQNVMAHFGTIDSDYRGEVKVKLWNLGDSPILVSRGDRICQGVLAAVAIADFVESGELTETERGVGGYGHTGR